MIQSFKYLSPEYMDAVNGFDCPDEISVELFLKEQALRLQQLRSAVTRLYFDENQNLVGYFTLYNDHVHIFPNQMVNHEWKLPEGIDLFPAVKLHYLGVDARYRFQDPEKTIRNRYGETMLADAIKLIETIAEKSGCNFVTIESLPSAVEFYERYGFKMRQRQHGRGEFYNMVIKLDELW